MTNDGASTPTKFSIIIPAYNVGRYLEECLASVACQTFGDFEVVIVDDASTDQTPAIARSWAARDARFRVVTHEVNKGLHLTRGTGVEAAAGAWLLFLDGDDTFEDETVLGRLAVIVDALTPDVLRFGLDAVATDGLADAAAAGFTAWSNAWCESLPGRKMAELVFDERRGYGICWHMSHRVFRASMLKDAFARMSQERLERAEDAYEYFVVTSLAEREDAACDIMGYRYRMGAGVTNARDLSRERFVREATAMRACYDAAAAYAENLGDEAYRRYAEGLKLKLVESAANMWNERIEDQDRVVAAEDFVGIVGDAEAGHEFLRFARDEAYAYLRHGKLPAEDDRLFELMAIADGVHVSDEDKSNVAQRYRAMRRVAERHMHDVERGLAARDRRETDIRIFVTTHKAVEVPQSGILQLVQVGPGLKDYRFVEALHDDEGENISELNDRYCELTTQYWAWKNVQADYVGFCHYRRYFSFADEFYQENVFGEVKDDFIDDEAVRRYGLDDETIRRCVEGYDVITTGFHDLREFPVEYVGEEGTPRSHWQAAPQLVDDDLELMASIVKELEPDYEVDVEAYLSAHTSCFCNMYIMRQDIFHEYCSWLFPLLEEFCARRDLSRYSHEALRTPGHLSERLFNIYYLHALRTDVGWRTKQLQCVNFDFPERSYPTLPPVFDNRADLRPCDVVPVVLAADDDYVPMLATTLLSLLENADPERFLDIVVFERNIHPRRKDELIQLVGRFGNASLRFHNVWRQVAEYHLSTSNEHITVETYYRFLIQEVLVGYDKVLYLDADLIVCDDVTRLFDTDLAGKLLAATVDIDFVGNACGADPWRMGYARDTLGLRDPYAYFQAGVLLLNTAELRKLHDVRTWLEIASTVDYIYDDQDILNVECQGRVVTLDPAWNVTHDCGARVGRIYSLAPAPMYDAYLAARKHPAIIHYAGFEKPWTYPRCDLAHAYWEYARRTPYYEEFMEILAPAAAMRAAKVLEEKLAREAEEARLAALPPKAVSEDSSLRGIIDPIAPLGTRRREVLKSVGRMVNKMRGHETGPDDSEAEAHPVF